MSGNKPVYPYPIIPAATNPLRLYHEQLHASIPFAILLGKLITIHVHICVHLCACVIGFRPGGFRTSLAIQDVGMLVLFGTRRIKNT